MEREIIHLFTAVLLLSATGHWLFIVTGSFNFGSKLQFAKNKKTNIYLYETELVHSHGTLHDQWLEISIVFASRARNEHFSRKNKRNKNFIYAFRRFCKTECVQK